MKANQKNQKSPEENLLSDEKGNNQAMGLMDGKVEGAGCESTRVDLPSFPDSVFDQLPSLLQKVVARCLSREERDMMLQGALTTLGSCLTKVFGKYGGKRVYPNLYLFVTAPASAGKGNLVYCRQLVNPIHEALRQEYLAERKIYKTGMRKFNAMRWTEFTMEKPEEPPEKMLFIPADNTSSGVFELLDDNDGRGLIFETEGDTLTNAFQMNNGHISDGLRKGYHHEMISFHRRKDHEHVEIKCPCISMLLTGTPMQVVSLIKSAENGLFSRFIYYRMNIWPEWKDMLSEDYDNMDAYFDDLGKEFHDFYKVLLTRPDIEFRLTPSQHEQFNAFFSQLHTQFIGLHGIDYAATVRRLGIVAFRMAMILTALRMMDTKDFSTRQECLDSDFQRVLSMIRVLVEHSAHVFSELPGDKQPVQALSNKDLFLKYLPLKFTRADFIGVAKVLFINERTAERYMVSFCESGLVVREQHGSYTRLKGESKEEKKE